MSEVINNNEIISDREYSELKIEVQTYFNEAVALAKEAKGSYKHILNNQAAKLLYMLEQNPTSENRVELFEDAKKNLDYLKRYYDLMKEFPDFAKTEQEQGTAFPQLFESLYSAEDMIDAYEKKLRS